MTKINEQRIPLSMLEKFYFSKRRTKTATVRRTKAEKRHMLADKLKDNSKREEK